MTQGAVDLATLPERPRETAWDLVSVLSSGFGIAVNHEAANPDPVGAGGSRSLANVFRTEDGGRTWHELELKVRWKLTQLFQRAFASWPVEEFMSLVIPRPGTVVLSWEDPWIYDGSRSHVIYSRDRGKSWRYSCLGFTNADLAVDASGRVLLPSAGLVWERVDGEAKWAKRELTVEWPPGYQHHRANVLRHVTFVEPGIAFALIVHWRRGTRFEPYKVGLLRTTDNGIHWHHVHVLEGPDTGDVNERHMLTLQVQ